MGKKKQASAALGKQIIKDRFGKKNKSDVDSFVSEIWRVDWANSAHRLLIMLIQIFLNRYQNFHFDTSF